MHMTHGPHLVLLNGRAKGHNTGEFTFISNSQASIIDYVMLSYDLFDLVLNFQIENHPESDHLSLALALSLPGQETY